MEQSKEIRPDTGIKALLKRAPVHYRLFCTKPKDGLEWLDRVTDLAMYFSIYLVYNLMYCREDWKVLLQGFGLIE